MKLLTQLKLDQLGHLNVSFFSSPINQLNNCIFFCKVLDASAKTSAGFLHGTVSSFGDYDQCLNINRGKDSSSVTGQYCTIKLAVDFNLTRSEKLSAIQSSILNHVPTFGYYYKQIALCLPSTCSPDDIDSIVKDGECLLRRT